MKNNNNKKYKINMKGLLLGLGGAVSVIAPVATVISCGGSSSDSKDPNFTGATQTMTVDDSNIKALPQNLTPYSVSELFADATRYGDKAMWNYGAAHQAEGATVSFIKGLAESYGWTRDSYIQKSGFILIDDSNFQKTDILPEDTSTNSRFYKVEAMRSIVEKSTPFTDKQKRDIRFESGDDGSWGNDYEIINAESANTHTYSSGGHHHYTLSNHVDSKGAPVKVDLNFTGAGGEYFADIKNPGDMKVELRDTSAKISRLLTIKDAFEKYPVLNDSQLHDEIAPYIKALIESFLKMYQGSASLAAGHIADETIDQLKFLIDKNTIVDPQNPNKSTFKIDDVEFGKHLKELNNGSTHWLAIKTFFRGIDSSFFSGGYSAYNMLDSAKNTTELKGVRDMTSIMNLIPWAKFNQTRVNGMRVNFVAGMTLDEMDKFNGYDVERTKQLTDLIADPKNKPFLDADTSVNALWAAFDTNGKTYSEVSEQIQRNQLLQKEAKYLLADTSTNALWTKFDWASKTIHEIQEQVAYNKLLESSIKYLQADTSTNAMWAKFDWTGKALQEIQDVVTKNKFIESSIKYLVADTSVNTLWTKFDWSTKTLDEIKEQAAYNKLLDTSIKYLQADTSANAMWTKFDWTGKTLQEIQDVVTKNKFIESSIKYLLADTSANALWTKFDWSAKTLDEIKVVVDRNKFVDNSANKKYLIADVNGKWQATTSLETKTLDELKAVVALHKVLEAFDKKYIANVDLTKSLVEVADALLWEKYKDVNAAEVALALTAKHLTPADLDAHKADIEAQVLQTFIEGLKAKGTLLVTATDAELSAFKDGDKWDQASHPIVKQSADYGKFKTEMLRLSGSNTNYGNFANGARAFIFHSFDATTITASFEYTITIGGVITHHSHDLTFYRHI